MKAAYASGTERRSPSKDTRDLDQLRSAVKKSSQATCNGRYLPCGDAQVRMLQLMRQAPRQSADPSELDEAAAGILLPSEVPALRSLRRQRESAPQYRSGFVVAGKGEQQSGEVDECAAVKI